MLWFLPLLKDLFVALLGAAGYKGIDITIKKKKERDLRIEREKNLKEEELIKNDKIREEDGILDYYSFNSPGVIEEEEKVKKELKVDIINKEEIKVEPVKSLKERRLSVTIPQDQDAMRSPLASTRLKQLL
jgi:hypothetical protein